MRFVKISDDVDITTDGLGKVEIHTLLPITETSSESYILGYFTDNGQWWEEHKEICPKYDNYYVAIFPYSDDEHWLIKSLDNHISIDVCEIIPF
ncbi:hypothetical protein [Planktothrix agardhii]|uniref:hypothetical protein n=1 Tax=Planktothrix agardhii TaxID=1160 RepID=UPI0004825D90|nr:hypothetical protein [Planktothrix agardhii]